MSLGRTGPGRPVSRVLYPDIIGVVTIHLAPTLPSGSSDQPGEGPGVPDSLYSVLLRMGFARPPIHIGAGELLPHHFTLVLPFGRTVCFCGTFRRVTPPGRYPASCPVELGLSSPILPDGVGGHRGGHPVYLTRLQCITGLVGSQYAGGFT
jgi:hypothetical protein